ncbi:MAG: Hsp20/alpha crystallin family protein [Candidatus Bathyarchaeota archaeon]|nr:Hsp20/alpha crystallin family protein [Candidatus Bathyarchaeota archaeon]
MSENQKKKAQYYSGKEKKASEITKTDEGIAPYAFFDVQLDFDRMMERFQREFEDFWELPPWRHGRRWRHRFPLMPQEVMAPSLDLEDCGSTFHLTLDLPGFKKENVDIEVDEDAVIVHAETARSEEETKKNYVRRERTSQTFYRRIPLPEKVRSEEAKACLNNGVLEITLPKKQPKEAKAKKLKID